MSDNYQRVLKKQLEWFLSPKSLGLERVDGPHAPMEQAQLISESYKNFIKAPLPSNMKHFSLSPDSSSNANQFVTKDEYLRPVEELIFWARENLRDYLLAFWIHGSIASHDYITGWSDLDTYLIVKKDTVLDAESLCDLRQLLLEGYKYLLQVDPLQHHGFLICSEFDLNNYLHGYLPVNVLQDSIEILGINSVHFSLPKISKNKKILPSVKALLEESVRTGVFKHHPFKGIYLQDNYQNRDNSMYQMKNFVSLIAMLPIYFYHDKGIECTKKDSFEKIYFEGIEGLDLLKIASDIRKTWHLREAHPYKGNKIPDWLEDMLGECYFSRALNLVDKLIKHS